MEKMLLTKLRTYHHIYNNALNMPTHSLSLKKMNGTHASILCKYIASSHKLEEEKGRWRGNSRGDRICRNCTMNVDETHEHFLIFCTKHNDIRTRFAVNARSISQIFQMKNIHLLISELDRNRRWENSYTSMDKEGFIFIVVFVFLFISFYCISCQ